jgi:hypothetical protein
LRAMIISAACSYKRTLPSIYVINECLRGKSG